MEIFNHDSIFIFYFSCDRRDRRLLVGAAELWAGQRLQRHALELREEIEVPPVAPELAVGDTLQADGFLLPDHVPNGLIFNFLQRFFFQRSFFPLGTRLGELPRSEKTADLVGAKGRLHSALAPESFTACAHFCASSRRKAANSPAVLARHSRPTIASRSSTSAAPTGRLTSRSARV